MRLCSISAKMMRNTVYGFLVLVSLSYTLGEEFNLFGDAGQAYSVEVNLGHPPQKVQAKYSQGMWVGHLASDWVQFPSLSNIPEVRTDLALITESHKFFMNGSGWQGLLGLAYLPVGAWGENVVVESWLDSVDRTLKKPISFQLKLCGVLNATNATHYGNFKMLDDATENKNTNQSYQTPVLRQRWYEVGVLSVRVINTNNNNSAPTQSTGTDIDNEICLKLNEEKSIVDSGTTNIRLPDTVFREIVGQIRNAVSKINVISDEFWYHGEAGCWPQPQEWSLPWIAIDLLSVDADNQYFTLEIPPQTYMRVVSTGEAGTDFVCYKLGLEAGPETVLGYTAMEGLQVLFNRSAGWIGWQTSNCGSNARITGPYNASTSLIDSCQLRRPVSETAVSIRAAQWALCAISIIAAGVLVYLLAPCVKAVCRKPLRTQQISLSTAALVEQET
ncbi:beta-secretase 1-like isoform X2 [Leguminivora glycinivorella]|uniref:beta-secretase 1-like isoform X2 n=1 Tax=Leguminivora glycinivorella TaxID=1035111 RepID=UPI00200EB833|nr:beta-secretase 1-like isoform X2 [Leguminivora glycinivorella]